MNNKRGLVKRFSKKEAELAMKISNDIAEDIDNGESRKQLRMAVAYYHDLFVTEAENRSADLSKFLLSELDRFFPKVP